MQHSWNTLMPKGFFTQGVCLLLERPVALDEIEAALSSFEIRGRRDAADSWAFGGPSLLVPYRPEVNGYATVDTVDRRWPDHMGDAQNEAMVFGAWSMGHFGPFAFPGGLERAGQQCWGWEEGATVAARHEAFIRVRISYVFGANGDVPVMPDDYEPLAELEFVTKIAASLLDLPAALCYFNPNGEVLRDQQGLRESLNYHGQHQIPPFDLWSNVRLFNVDEEWSLMDTVGNAQLDLADIEASFHSQCYDFEEVALFLRNASLYLLQNGQIIQDGDTMDGPGDIRWQARQFDRGVCDPPRTVLRWLPMDHRQPPPEIANAGDGA